MFSSSISDVVALSCVAPWKTLYHRLEGRVAEGSHTSNSECVFACTGKSSEQVALELKKHFTEDTSHAPPAP